MNYYTSDLHLGHENIISICKRPFATVEEMDEILITNWNSVVKAEDTVFILGDLIYKNARAPEYYLDRLKGKKVLILGNHDTWFRKNLIKYERYFENTEGYHYLEVSDQGRRVVLFHYPILEWNAYYRGAYHIYGHVHDDFKSSDINYRIVRNETKMLNACSDLNYFYPVTLDQLIAHKNINT